MTKPNNSSYTTGFFQPLFVYSTQRIVKIPNKCLAITYLVIVVGVILYIAIYGLAISRGYQAIAQIESVVVTKVKGVLYANYTDEELGVSHPELYRRIWDSNDIVIPAHGGENGGFFVVTNLIITPNQTRSICPEDHRVDGAKCTKDSQCEAGKSLNIGNGIMTSNCVPSDKVRNTKTCEIMAWCPVEGHIKPLEKMNKPLLLETRDFTVLVKNSIEFPSLGPRYRKRNILESFKNTYLQTCIYNTKTDPYCPTFRIGDIVSGSGFDYAQIGLSGGVFAIKVKWFCDFDWGKSLDKCLPKYSFARLDNPNVAISPGFNFRSAVFHEENRRTLTQYFGIKILIEVEGEGRKFDSLKFALAVGASVGFFALASLICDQIFVLLCVLKQHFGWKWLQFYNEEMKYDLTHVNAKESGISADAVEMEALKSQQRS